MCKILERRGIPLRLRIAGCLPGRGAHICRFLRIPDPIECMRGRSAKWQNWLDDWHFSEHKLLVTASAAVERNEPCLIETWQCESVGSCRASRQPGCNNLCDRRGPVLLVRGFWRSRKRMHGMHIADAMATTWSPGQGGVAPGHEREIVLGSETFTVPPALWCMGGSFHR